MAITRNAKKAVRSHARKRVFNIRTKEKLHDTVKTLKDALAGGKLDEAKALIPAVQKAIDKAAKRGVLKKNTASRKKARLSAQLTKAGK